MNATLQRIHDIGARAWLLFLQALNWFAGGVCAVVLLINAAYPQAVTQLAGDLPTPLKLAGVGLWFLVVHYATRRAKKAL